MGPWVLPGGAQKLAEEGEFDLGFEGWLRVHQLEETRGGL